MKHYIDPNTGILYAYESDGSQDYIIPASYQLATDAEVQAIQNPPPPIPTVQDKLNALDAANTLTQRNLRETVMLMAEAFKQVSAGAVNLSAIPGVAKVYQVEAEAAVLRAQL